MKGWDMGTLVIGGGGLEMERVGHEDTGNRWRRSGDGKGGT